MKDTKKWTEHFIEKARKKHGDKFDYSKVEYKGVHTKVCVICHAKDAAGKEHGEFYVTPHKHFEGIGCPKCSPKHKFTTEEFIALAKERVEEDYDYSKVSYTTSNENITVICHKKDIAGNEHGEFKITPNGLFGGRRCPKCSSTHKYTTAEFIVLAKKVHGEKYDYSKVDYTGMGNNICLICHEKDITGKEHGEFYIAPHSVLNGCGCSKCSNKHHYNNDEFIEKANVIHNGKYDYSHTQYVKGKENIRIICPKHGEFSIAASAHLAGKGCPECGRSKNGTVCTDTESFIRLAKQTHGEKYDYSESVYEGSRIPIKIICHEKDKFGNEHGLFLQNPSDHIIGRGCQKCNNVYERTTEEFIKEASIIHNNKYDYSKTVFNRLKDKVIITCPIHGDFEQKAGVHLRGAGCWNCGNDLKKNTNEGFIELSKLKHGDYYDYSLVEYGNNRDKVCIICPEHGPFWQVAAYHLRGAGCPKCIGRKITEKKTYTQEQFIEKARKKHGNKYDYSKLEYVNGTVEVCIICPVHGEFMQNPISHLSGHGCLKCQYEYIANIRREDVDEFIEQAKAVHGSKYKYDKVVYKNQHTPVVITCPIHGDFLQNPVGHLAGHGCQKCASSKLETAVSVFLENHGIEFEAQKTFEWLKSKSYLKLDFYIPSANIAIECQGEQHFRPVHFFGGVLAFQATQNRDNIKRSQCESHGVRMVYINYDDDVENVLRENLRGVIKPIQYEFQF